MMNRDDIIRAWKSDEEGKKDEQEKTDKQVPPSPVGQIELSDEELAQISGGSGVTWLQSEKEVPM